MTQFFNLPGVHHYVINVFVPRQCQPITYTDIIDNDISIEKNTLRITYQNSVIVYPFTAINSFEVILVYYRLNGKNYNQKREVIG